MWKLVLQPQKLAGSMFIYWRVLIHYIHTFVPEDLRVASLERQKKSWRFRRRTLQHCWWRLRIWLLAFSTSPRSFAPLADSCDCLRIARKSWFPGDIAGFRRAGKFSRENKGRRKMVQWIGILNMMLLLEESWCWIVGDT